MADCGRTGLGFLREMLELFGAVTRPSPSDCYGSYFSGRVIQSLPLLGVHNEAMADKRRADLSQG